MAMVRLKDIADVCGVSTATVSRVLNGLNLGNSKIAETIRRTAREMGYVPNAAALALKTSRSNTIGILYEDQMNHEYFSLLLNDLRREATARGYDLTLIGDSGEEGGNYYEHARKRNLDGVIVIRADFDSAEVIRLATSGLPSVVIDHRYEGCNCVTNDNQGSMEQIVRYAWEKGHRRIALIAGQVGAVTNERLAGFYKACAELGIRVPEGSVREGTFHDPEGCLSLVRELMKEPTGATCIICQDDYSCLGAMWRLKEEGIRIPEEVSLIGYDGIRMGQMVPPHLTTYRQDTAEIAAETLKLLAETIENPETHIARQVVVEGTLLEGETVEELSR